MKIFEHILLKTLLLIFVFTVIACQESQWHEQIEDEEILPPAPITVDASKKNINLFEATTLSMTVDKNEYDSVMWKIADIYDQVFKYSSIGLLWEMGFHKEGNYEMYIDGYKNGKAYRSNTVNMEVYSDGHFLGIDWNSELIMHFGQFTCDDYNLILAHSLLDCGPYAILRYEPSDNIIDEEERMLSHKNSRKILEDYITSIYGVSDFSYDGEDIYASGLIEEYTRRFNVELNHIFGFYDYAPLAIWDIQDSYVALVGAQDPRNINQHYYRVIAEPRTK